MSNNMLSRKEQNRNSSSSLFKKLTKLFSGPIVNYRTQAYRRERRRQLDKYKFRSASGKQFKKSTYDPFANITFNYVAAQGRAERYVDFDQMEFMPEIACFPGDTEVHTLAGMVNLRELCEKYPNGEEFEVWCWDTERSQYTIGIAHSPRKTGTKNIVRISLDNGASFECTPDHRIMMVDGTYKQAGSLVGDDAVMPFDAKYDKKGYLKVRTKNKGKYKYAHRYIYENIYEREIGSLNVHHINEIKEDNRTSNLKLLTAQEHMRVHKISDKTNNQRSQTVKKLWKSSEYRERALSGIRSWQSSQEGKRFMSEHTTQLNKKRWAEDADYAAKMSEIFSQHAKSLWADPDWAKWKREHHSKVLKTKYANDPQYRLKVANLGATNGRFYKEITNENILLAGLHYKTLKSLADSFDFGKKKFSHYNGKIQFIQRRLNNCGYNSWKDYKENYVYRNHKVIAVEILSESVDVYDLTVKHHENFAIGSGVIVSNSAMDIYADEMTTSTFINQILRIDCQNSEIKQLLEHLYSNILNIEFNLFGWCRTMCKMGDFFLYLEIEEGKGVTNAIGLPVQEVERMEGEDPTNPNYVQYQWNSGGLTFENWQIAHFRILGNDKYTPYGTSVLEPARRIWRQLTLLEDAMMSYRIVRSPERRMFKIEVGNIPPQDVEQYVQRVVTQMKRNQIIDPETGRVDLRYNPLSVDEDYFLPVRNGVGSSIETLSGGAYTGDIDDIKYLQDKLFAALKVPQSYLIRGEGGEEEKTALAQKDIRFARTIQRLQRSVVSELEKVGIIHLYTLGYKDRDLISFKLNLSNPSRIAELQELEYWRTKFEIAGGATEGFFSKRWVAQNVFNLSEGEFLRNQREQYFDRIFATQLEQASEEAVGGAPAGSGGLDMGGEGLDLGGEEGGLDLDAGGEDLGAEEPAGDEEMLLAAPGKRDELRTTTKASKGKWYKPVPKELDKRRHMAPRRKSMKRQFSDRLASSSRENVMPALNTISRLGKGIYEDKEPIYSLNESIILNSNDEVENLISQLETKTDENK